MTAQQCSIIRNFVQNPIAVQGFIEALDRYFIIFDHGVLHPVTILTLYALFPIASILTAVYNSFLTSDWVKDDVVCLITRRSAWTSDFLFAIQWLATIAAIILYFRIYRKVRKHVRRQHMNKTLTQERYYRDRSIVSLFFVCCTIPVILLTPTIAVTLINAIFSIRNKVITLISWICLDLSIPFIWTVYLIYIPSIRQGVLDMFGLSSLKLFTPAPSSQSSS
ncbi:hypothetical protein OESDEN_25001 [Oesophagostomum dentatum]|uniref:Uncharacterized protein n=1 Tax=Oesophagostomum dentatum TaxID=61180 RepID=A0A0B1RQP3_OESDE|nr:hypothetical protein OESDEN_25001 [Oesophagostomum dentatum]